MATTLNTRGYDNPIVYKDKALSSTVVCPAGQPTNLTGWRITNPNSTTAYIKFFDSATAGGVILGTTEPVKEFSIPAMGEIFVSHMRGVSQYYFANGICLVAVNGLATSSTSTPILNLDVEIYMARNYGGL